MDRSAPFGSDDIPENDDQIVVSSPRDSTMSDVEKANRRIEMLEEKLLEARGALAQSRSNNEKLTITIQQTRDQITALRDEVEKLTQPPAVYGTFIDFNDDGTVDIFASGRKMRGALHPGPDPGHIARACRAGRPTGRLPQPRETPQWRRASAGHALEPAGREALASRGRRVDPRRGARHHLCRRRGAGLPDRSCPRRRGVAVPAPRAVQRLRPAGAQRHPPLRTAGMWQDTHRQGGRQLALAKSRGVDRQPQRTFVLLEHQGTGAFK